MANSAFSPIAAGRSGFVYLTTKNISGGETNIEFLASDGLVAANYKSFYFSMKIKHSTNTYLKLDIGYGSPVVYTHATNRYINTSFSTAGQNLQGAELVDTIALTPNNMESTGSFSGDGITGELYIYNAAAANLGWGQFIGRFFFFSEANGLVNLNHHGNMTGFVGDITGLKFFMNSGTLTNGHISLYGITS